MVYLIIDHFIENNLKKNQNPSLKIHFNDCALQAW